MAGMNESSVRVDEGLFGEGWSMKNKRLPTQGLANALLRYYFPLTQTPLPTWPN